MNFAVQILLDDMQFWQELLTDTKNYLKREETISVYVLALLTGGVRYINSIC